MEDTSDLINRAAHDMRIGQTGGAVDKLRDALTIDPNDALAHVLLASCLMGQRRLHAARHETDLAIQLQPEFAFAHRMRGLIAFSENDMEQMAASMRQAVELDPDDPDNIVGLARYHRAKNDLATAIELADKALETEPGDIDALVFRGELALAAGDLERAHAVADASLKLNPENPEALVLLGNIKLREGDIENARDLALWALQLDASDTDALMLLTSIKMKQSPVLGVFWKFQTWMARLGAERAMLVLICAFVVYSIGLVALRDFGYPGLTQPLTFVWLGLCLYTWIGAGIQDRMVQKELARVKLRPEF